MEQNKPTIEIRNQERKEIMLDYILNSFKKDKPKEVRFCNSCGFVWQEEATGKTRFALGDSLCPRCRGIDTQLETALHRANPDTMKERQERYFKSHPKDIPE
jgi:hypothetical protein